MLHLRNTYLSSYLNYIYMMMIYMMVTMIYIGPSRLNSPTNTALASTCTAHLQHCLHIMIPLQEATPSSSLRLASKRHPSHESDVKSLQTGLGAINNNNQQPSSKLIFMMLN
ncbi:hypothetical protein Scep_017940 [Stephania cephalantha]|uniref:Uncharacterized protein n=1 Tax=Stephania cephalantha TaxID=152367 RepID=A0AAP0IQG7_9MAGN